MKQRLPLNLHSPGKSMTHVVRRDIALPDALFFRAAQPSDESMVFHSFIESMKMNIQLFNTNPLLRMKSSDMRRCYRQMLKSLLLRGAAIVVLADASEADNIAGWICFERKDKRVCIHFIHVKYALQRLGYATYLYRFATRNLHEDDTVHVSILTPTARNILNEKRVPFQHRPELLFAANTFQTIEDLYA